MNISCGSTTSGRRQALCAVLLVPLALIAGCIRDDAAAGPGRDITSYSVAYAAGFASGAIDGTRMPRTIEVAVPIGTDVSALVATFSTNGARVMVGGTVQVSGSTVNDFSSSTNYLVAAADGSTAVYVVTVRTALFVDPNGVDSVVQGGAKGARAL